MVTTEAIQEFLDENQTLILAILENQNVGKLNECAMCAAPRCQLHRCPMKHSTPHAAYPSCRDRMHRYQQRLQQNLLYLATIADAQPARVSVPTPPASACHCPSY